MNKPTYQDFRTADAMIEYFSIYDKFGNREKGPARRITAKNKLAEGSDN